MNHAISRNGNCVIKADGLAAGKGVTVVDNDDVERAITAIEQAMIQKVFGEAGKTVIIEERLFGEEASIMIFVDGEHYLIMPSSQDHKSIFDGDKGPNTGGMGAYSPAHMITPQMMQQIEDKIVKPNEEIDYHGVLYIGLIITADGPKVLEYNVRFGDPETQVVVPRIKNDIVPIMLACIDGTLDQHRLEIDERAAVCVVLASHGYPGKYEKGKVIDGLKYVRQIADSMIFHAGTKIVGGQVVTDGGRVLGATALGEDLAQAYDRAYQLAGLVDFQGKYYRTDIGQKALRHLNAR